MKNYLRKNWRKIALIAGSIALLLIISLILKKGSTIDVNNPKVTPTNTVDHIAPLSGLACENATSRPFAVMMPSDPEARPLTGIGQADMVFEMPVTESGVTRMMAVFQCTHPDEFGSIRSARMDFIPFVLGLDALYMHWGGEHEALAALNGGLTDNIDCLKLDGSTCLRKKGVPSPHDGYSTSKLLLAKAKALGYTLLDSSVSYPHLPLSTDHYSLTTTIPPLFNSGNRVTWTYDPATNLYARTRVRKYEIDLSTGRQVTASNIAVLHTTSTYVNYLYNRVKTIGSGKMTLYQNGKAIEGTWKKSTQSSKLLFLDTAGREIPFVPGSTWVEIITE